MNLKDPLFADSDRFASVAREIPARASWRPDSSDPRS